MSVHTVDPPGAVVASLLAWYRRNARDLPWRRPGTTPWAVLVSEVMLQQTPVVRVESFWRDWLARWPTPAALAGATPGDAVQAWGTLGYPRRALRLHEAAVAIVRDHGGELPADVDALRRLPGVGSYTAAAVASFAYRQRHAVLDTNVRRVLGRVFTGVEYPPAGGTSVAERPEEQLAPNNPSLRSLALYMSRRSRCDIPGRLSKGGLLGARGACAVRLGCEVD